MNSFTALLSTNSSTPSKSFPLLLFVFAFFNLFIKNNEALKIDGVDYPDPDVGLVLLPGNFQNDMEEENQLSSSTESLSKSASRTGIAPKFYISTFRASAHVADNYCSDTGRQLVSLQTDKKQSDLMKHLKEAGMCESLWTSGNDVEHEGDWVWGNGEEIGYNNFEDYSLNNELYNCLSFNLQKPKDKSWVVEYCGTRKIFVCEF